jgi:hypothetical protein
MLWFGRSWVLLLALSGLMLLSSCGKIPSFLTGGGPNVAANVQAGKTNSQTVGTTNNVNPTVTLKPNSKVDTVDQSSETVNNYEIDPILFGTLLLCFVVWSYFLYKLPSPDQIWKRR